MKKYLFMIAAALALTIQTISQTIINAGPVSGTWTASGSPYHIMGDIEVPAGNTLIIEPGVTVKIFSELSFKVYGQLLVEGTETDSIFFIPVSEYWKGLQLLNSPDTSKFKYCSFKNFKKKSINNQYIKGGVFYIINTKLILNHSLLTNNQIFYNGYPTPYGMGGAVYVEGNANISENGIKNNSIQINISITCVASALAKGGGIFAEGNDCWINNNIIQGNYCKTEASAGYVPQICGGDAFAQSLGGGIYGGNIQNNLIIDNYCYSTGEGFGYGVFYSSALAEAKGGGVFGANVLENNLIKNNHCYTFANSDGGILSNCRGGGVEGGLSQNNTIINNNLLATTGSGGTIEVYGSGVNSCTIKNCIVYNNSGAAQISNSTATYSCIQDGYAGQGNISSNPFFISGPQGNYYLKQYPCQGQQSPCVDSGDPSITLFPGTTRTDEYPDTGIIDMGFHYLFLSNFAAKFSTDKNCGEAPLNVNFYDNSFTYLIPIIQWEWDFQNDGTIESFDQNPIWTYNETGNYGVKMIITGQVGDDIYFDTIIKENYINVCLMTPGFTQDTTTGYYHLTVQFTDTSQVINSEIEQWQWDFENDGIIDSYEQNPTWTYEHGGIFSVLLIITDSCGFINDTIAKDSLIEIIGVCAEFNADQLIGSIPFTVSFSDMSNGYMTTLFKWEWDFQNDGIIDSFEQDPFCTYESYGYYNVKLIVSGQYEGDTLTDTIVKSNYITAYKIIPGFTQNTTYGEMPLQVHFYDTSQILPLLQINLFRWDFDNDGQIDAYNQNPFHVYSEPGNYSVKLIVGNSTLMIFDTILKENLITVCKIIPEFYAESLSGYNPLDVSFYDTSYIEYTQISTWKWDFQHDGVIDAYGPSPTWNYPEAGIYSVELRITDTSGQIWKSVVKENYIIVNSITGISNQSKENSGNKIEIYPNPFANDLIIEFEFDNPEVTTLQIFDVAFKPIETIAKDEKITACKKSWKWENCNNLASGIYYISLTTSSDKLFIKKCIKVD